MNPIEVVKEDAEHVILRRNGKTLTLTDEWATQLAEDIYVRIADYRAQHKEEDAGET